MLLSSSHRMSSPVPLPPILSLPPETILHILTFAGPVAAAHFTATCKAAHAFQCPALHKDLFLSLFDPPPVSETHSYPYRHHLERRIRARTWIQSDTTIIKLQTRLDELETTLAALCDIAATRTLFTAPGDSRNEAFLEQYLPNNSANVQLLNPVRKGGHSLRSTDSKLAATQLAAQLHVLHTPTFVALASPGLRTAAREVVYDQTNFTRHANWGPFIDGSGRKGRRHLKVDWRKLEALAIVMGTNLGEAINSGWAKDTSLPSGWDMTRSGAPDPGDRDWAGVESQSFIGTYSFLDYRVFEHFNFHRTRTYMPTLDDETEAVGECMKITLKLLPPGEEPKPRTFPGDHWFHSDDDSSDEDDASFHPDSATEPSEPSVSSDDEDGQAPLDVPGSPDPSPPTSEIDGSSGSTSSATPESSQSKGKGKAVDDSHPKLNFSGKSERLTFDGVFAHGTTPQDQMPRRSIHGSVVMTDEGQVHWQYTISYGGGPQWLMHGVQIGGAKSRLGVVGVWSTHNHEPAGPNGPFWYWPVQT